MVVVMVNKTECCGKMAAHVILLSAYVSSHQLNA